MKLRLLIETLVHLRPKQMVYQVITKVSKPKMKAVTAPVMRQGIKTVPPIEKYPCCSGNEVTFLNIKDTFNSWNQTEHGMLWAYNLNYMDWLGQKGISAQDCEYWIDKFISELPQNYVGQDPYPIALRSINWIKFFCQYPDKASQGRLDSLYSQVMLLEKKLEHRLLGNHLLEDAYALFIASLYFDDMRLYKKATKLLLAQLKEQVLADGAHYEQSPMYHCVLLDRLLDCLNFSKSLTENTDNGSPAKKAEMTKTLTAYAVKMLGHLESVIWNDGSIPLLNDTAEGIAPTAEQLFGYAKRLGLSWTAIQMNECGYRKMTNNRLEVIADVGNMTATYQAGHSHADTLNYELRLDGKPIVVDSGISTYNNNRRRQYERSTIAHNCVSVDEKNSSEVWGGFRVGRRCKAIIHKDTAKHIVASQNGFKHLCQREFLIEDNAFIVIDRYNGSAISYIHLAPGVSPDTIKVENADKVVTCDEQVSKEYNEFIDTKMIKIYFTNYCKYQVIV